MLKNSDGDGHGTHVAGIAAGAVMGVASRVDVVAVKVLGNDGTGTTSGVISGLQWVVSNKADKSVINMSLGINGIATSLNAAVRSTISAGITVVVAAGNDNTDANGVSPALEELAITVGAIDKSDTRAIFSSYGSAVDVWAPGVSIGSAWNTGDNVINIFSGISMATPHVSGLAVYLIALEGLGSPAAVQDRIKQLATKGKVNESIGSISGIAYNGNGA